jgi:hypothetical protein
MLWMMPVIQTPPHELAWVWRSPFCMKRDPLYHHLKRIIKRQGKAELETDLDPPENFPTLASEFGASAKA